MSGTAAAFWFSSSGNNAFPDWPVYNQMIGLGWRK